MSRACRRATTGGTRRVAAERWLAVVLAAALVTAGCTDSGGDQPAALPREIDTVPIGELPEERSDPPPLIEPPNAPPVTTTTTEPEALLSGPIGQLVVGNRVLVIGDGVFARIEPSSNGVLCDVLPDAGWFVESAAASGRDLEFGQRVLDVAIDPERELDVDAAVILLGNLFDGDLDGFTAELDALVERLSPRPVVLFTLTELDDEAELNELFRATADALPNVRVVDWAGISAAESGELLLDGGPLTSRQGSERLVELIAAELGDAPTADEIDCIELEVR